jgi:hypothetical protein
MIPVGNLFIINESVFEDTKEALAKYFKIPEVKQFIDLSKKVISDGVTSLSEKEQETYRGLFDDPGVKNYISAARRAGERDGWLKGGTIGGIAGGGIGSLTGTGIAKAAEFGAGGTITLFIMLGLLGAAAGGAALGWTFSKALSWIRKWKAEDDVVTLGKVGGRIGRTTPIVGANIKI